MAWSDLQEIEVGDISTWPTWFRVTMAFVVCGAILGAGYWFIVRHDIEDLRRVEQQEQTLRETFLKQKALAVNLPAYREQMKQIERNFGVMLRQLPDKTEVPELLIEITQAGLARGLQFELFKPRNKSVGDFYATLPIDIRVTGPYHLVAEFVSDLAAMPRIVTIGNIDLSPLDGAGQRLRMSAITYTFHYLDEEEIAARRDQEKARTVRK